MSGLLCGIAAYFLVVVAQPENGQYNYLLKSYNVPQRQCGESALVTGEVDIAWNSDTLPAMDEKKYYWRRIWATCQPIWGIATMPTGYSFGYHKWICDATKVEME